MNKIYFEPFLVWNQRKVNSFKNENGHALDEWRLVAIIKKIMSVETNLCVSKMTHSYGQIPIYIGPK